MPPLRIKGLSLFIATYWIERKIAANVTESLALRYKERTEAEHNHNVKGRKSCNKSPSISFTCPSFLWIINVSWTSVSFQGKLIYIQQLHAGNGKKKQDYLRLPSSLFFQQVSHSVPRTITSVSSGLKATTRLQQRYFVLYSLMRNSVVT